MPQREPRPVKASPHVTVYRADGKPVRYPKAQLSRIATSEILFIDDPTAVDPGETPEPPKEAKVKKPSAKTGAKK